MKAITTNEMLLSRVITDTGRVALIRNTVVGAVRGKGKVRSGSGNGFEFEVWSSFPGVNGFKEQRYETFDEAFAAYELEVLKLY